MLSNMNRHGRMVLASPSHIFVYTVPWGFGFGIQNFAMGQAAVPCGWGTKCFLGYETTCARIKTSARTVVSKKAEGKRRTLGEQRAKESLKTGAKS